MPDLTPPPRKVAFDQLDPAPEAPGIASETQEIGGHRWARVRYEPGVLREEWCDEGHEGFVLEGEVTYEFQDGTDPLRLRAGEAFSLPGARVHRGQAGPEGARLFIIDREPE
jgi:quercetin dioxygenase-like cupin family protein